MHVKTICKTGKNIENVTFLILHILIKEKTYGIKYVPANSIDNKATSSWIVPMRPSPPVAPIFATDIKVPIQVIIDMGIGNAISI